MPRLTKVEKKLGRERAMGEAIFGENEICIDPRQSSKDYLDTLTHEAMHLALPELNEEAITTSATFVARILWRQCRKPDVIPHGWMDAGQFAAKWKTSVYASRRALAIGFRAGVVEKKRFLVKTKRSTVLVSFFRPLEKKRGK